MSSLIAYAKSFKRTLLAENKSPRTVETYTEAVGLLDRFLSANDLPTDPKKVQRKHIQSFIAHLLEQWKPATAHNRYRSLRAFFKWLVDEGEIDGSPMAGMKPPILPEEPTTLMVLLRLARHDECSLSMSASCRLHVMDGARELRMLIEPEELRAEAYRLLDEAQRLDGEIARAGMPDLGVELTQEQLDQRLLEGKRLRSEAKRLENRAVATQRARRRGIPEIVEGGDLVGNATQRQKDVASRIGYLKPGPRQNTPAGMVKALDRRRGEMVDWRAVMRLAEAKDLPPGTIRAGEWQAPDSSQVWEFFLVPTTDSWMS